MCCAIDLVSTNSAGIQGTTTSTPRTRGVSNDGDTVLFSYDDPNFIPGIGDSIFYIKTLSTGIALPVQKRPDGLPPQDGSRGSHAYMDEPSTRVVFPTYEGNLGPGVGGPGLKIVSTVIGSYQYLPAQGIPGGPAMPFFDFTADGSLDRIYLRSSAIVEVSASLPTPPIVHTIRPDGSPSQFGSGIASDEQPSLSVSNDGRILAWWGLHFDLDPGESPRDAQIYIKDTQTGVVRQVRADNGEDLIFADFPHVSADGNFVAFRVGSYFTPICGRFSIVSIDTRSGQRDCIAQNTAGLPANGSSHNLDISGDGNRVVFDSFANNLGPTPGTFRVQSGVYVRDRRLGRTVRVDVNAAGIPSNGNGNGGPFDLGWQTLRYPSISKNGRWVVFSSNGSNLVPNDSNGHRDDVFRVDLNQFFSGPIAPLVPVPALSLWAGLLLILTVMGSSVWLKRGPAL